MVSTAVLYVDLSGLMIKNKGEKNMEISMDKKYQNRDGEGLQ